MPNTLIKAREGVHGRQVTEKERELLTQFASEYVASTSARAAADAAALKRLKGKMLLVEGRPGAQTKAIRAKPVAGSGNARPRAAPRQKAASGAKVPRVAAKRTAKAAK